MSKTSRKAFNTQAEARQSWKLRKGKCLVFLTSVNMNAKLLLTLSFIKQNQFTFDVLGTLSGDFCPTHCMDSSDSVGVGVVNVDLDTSTFLLLTLDLEDSESEEADNCFSLLLCQTTGLVLELRSLI